MRHSVHNVDRSCNLYYGYNWKQVEIAVFRQRSEDPHPSFDYKVFVYQSAENRGEYQGVIFSSVIIAVATNKSAPRIREVMFKFAVECFT